MVPGTGLQNQYWFVEKYWFVDLLMLKNQYWNIDMLICWNRNQQKNIDFENDQQIQQINICWKMAKF